MPVPAACVGRPGSLTSSRPRVLVGAPSLRTISACARSANAIMDAGSPQACQRDNPVEVHATVLPSSKVRSISALSELGVPFLVSSSYSITNTTSTFASAMPYPNDSRHGPSPIVYKNSIFASLCRVGTAPTRSESGSQGPCRNFESNDSGVTASGMSESVITTAPSRSTSESCSIRRAPARGIVDGPA